MADQARLRLSSGGELAYLTAGNRASPALLLLHGFPNSSLGFRHVIPALARHAFVVAPDLPGFGRSTPLSETSFDAMADAVSELLLALSIQRRIIYLHDYGAPVGLRIALDAPDLVRGLIIQNANAHESGLGPEWEQTRQYWRHATPENERAATAHLTLEGLRDQYVAGVPADVIQRIQGEPWLEDWRVLNLPGRMTANRALVADYATHVARFGAIQDYLSQAQPPALLLWGRHDAFFHLDETLSWMKALPRMEAHLFDAGHFLLETHAEAAADAMIDFVARLEDRKRSNP